MINAAFKRFAVGEGYRVVPQLASQFALEAIRLSRDALEMIAKHAPATGALGPAICRVEITTGMHHWLVASVIAFTLRPGASAAVTAVSLFPT